MTNLLVESSSMNVQEISLAETGSCFAPENPVPPLLNAALVNPPDFSSSDSWNRWIPPLGLGYVASVARKYGFHIDLFDISRNLNLEDEFLKEIGFFDDYAVYGISTYTEIWASALDVARRIRRYAPNAVIVVGGYHATSVGSPILEDYSEIDVVVCNEGEEPFTELLQAIASKTSLAEIKGLIWRDVSGEVIQNESCKNILKLDLLPHPVRDYKYFPDKHWNLTLGETNSNKATISLVSSRGCPKRCTFCSIIVLSPYYRMRSVASLMEEIKHLYSKNPFGHIVFQDANFFVKVSRTLEFARELYNFNPNLTWSGTATADQVSDHAEILNEIGKLNCAFLEIGIESGNANTLSRLNKRTKVEHNELALSLLAKAGIGIGLDFIMFEPDMTYDDLVENVRFLLRTELFGYFPCEVLFQEMRLFPKTPIREVHEKRLNVKFNPHIVPQTPFYNQAIETAWKCMQWYVSNYHLMINQLVRELIEPVNRLLFNTRENIETDKKLVRLCQEAHKSLIYLRHLPYHFLVRLINQQKALEDGLEPEEIVKLLNLNDLDEKISEAEKVKAELLLYVKGTSLEKIARTWVVEAV